MPFQRRFVHYSPGPTDLVGVIDSCRVPEGAWFELHRQGGCGDGEMLLHEGDSSGEDVDIGDWIAFEYDTNGRWYFGQVKSRRTIGFGTQRLHLAGMGRQLRNICPGGFGADIADGWLPHRYAKSDLFSFDPDRSAETVDAVSEPAELIRLLVQQYVTPNSPITYDSGLVEDPTNSAAVVSIKVRGEESVHSLLSDLAVRVGGASWGVDADGRFFFLNPKTALLATYQQGVDVVSLSEIHRRDLIFNRLQVTGGWVYGEPLSSGVSPRGLYRWMGRYVQPASRTAYGERPIELTIPWVRTPTDAREFAREFFRVYAQPATTFLLQTAEQSTLPRPWDGQIRLKNSSGNELYAGSFESIRVQFDHSPRFRVELGPVDPRIHWPQRKVDDRWPIGPMLAGDEITWTTGESSFSSGPPSESGSSSVPSLSSGSSEPVSSEPEPPSSSSVPSSSEPDLSSDSSGGSFSGSGILSSFSF